MASLASKNSFLTGIHSEQQACAYLEDLGYNVLSKRYKSPFGEIDIIAKLANTLVFVEVKGTAGKILPLNRISPRQQQRFASAAAHYLSQNNLPMNTPAQIDAIFVCGNEIKHIQNSWESSI